MKHFCSALDRLFVSINFDRYDSSKLEFPSRRTWTEYSEVIDKLAQANEDITPSCTTLLHQPRCDYCSLTTNVHAVLSTMTQVSSIFLATPTNVCDGIMC